MRFDPETRAEAEKKKYGPSYDSRSFDEEHCAATVFGPYRPYQCTRKPGHGPDHLYCKQHAKQFVNNG